MLWVDHIAGHHYLTLGDTFPNYLDSGVSPALETWQHVAATSDGVTARYYVDGVEVASRALSGSVGTSNTWRIGAYGAGAWRVPGRRRRRRPRSTTAPSARARSSSTATTASSRCPCRPTLTPPSAPGTLAATGGVGQISLSWGAATDNMGVVGYNVHRSTSAGFTPSAANRIAQPTGTTFADTGLAAGATYYYKVTAEDAAGQRRPGLERGDRDRLRPDPAERTGHARRDRRLRPGVALVGCGDGQRRRRPLQRPPLDDVRFHADEREPDRAADRHELHEHRPSPPAPTTTR